MTWPNILILGMIRKNKHLSCRLLSTSNNCSLTKDIQVKKKVQNSPILGAPTLEWQDCAYACFLFVFLKIRYMLSGMCIN